MKILPEEVAREVKIAFKDLDRKVKLIVFTQESLVQLPGLECANCRDNRMLMEDLASLSDKIELEILDFLQNQEKAKQLEVDKIPATLVTADQNYRIRFFGWPGGYEFSTLLHAIKLVSRNESNLSDKTKEALKEIKKPIHIQVFVTPTCPYCPMAVKLAHSFAMESEFITADMINASEFPHLANRYAVHAVPKTIINENFSFEGAIPESRLLELILKSISDTGLRF